MVTVGILNYTRPKEYVDTLLHAIDNQIGVEVDRIIIVSDKGDEFCRDGVCHIDNTFSNIAEAKNSIIQRALEYGDNNKLFIIEDDVTIIRDDALKVYLDTMDTLNLPVLFSCYTNTSNYVITKPSPRANIMFKYDNVPIKGVSTNRYEVGDFLLINLNVNKLEFNESLMYYEFSEYVFRCKKEGHIIALNQFFDVFESWKYLTFNEKCASLRKYDQKGMDNEKKRIDVLINNEWKIENDIKVVVDYIRQQIGV